MQPGLSRAIPMGLLGFLFGALVVIIIRALQGLTPLWDLGVGMSLAAFTTAGFFVWGMGAFNPAANAHGEEAEALQAEAEKNLNNAPPRQILIGSTWTLSAMLIMVIVILFAFASLPGGLALTTTADPDASLVIAGMVPVDLFGTTVEVSQLVIFAVFIIVMFLSLVLAAAVIAWLFTGAHRGVVEARALAAAGGPGLSEQTGVPQAPAGRPAWLNTALTVALFVVVFTVLYLLFYYVAIGLILPRPDLPGLNILFPDPATQLAVISAINAALFTVLILRPTVVLHFIGRVARGVVNALRRVPNALQ